MSGLSHARGGRRNSAVTPEHDEMSRTLQMSQENARQHEPVADRALTGGRFYTVNEVPVEQVHDTRVEQTRFQGRRVRGRA